MRFAEFLCALFVEKFHATNKRADLLASEGGIVFVHMVIVRNRAQIVGGGDECYFGNMLVEKGLTLSEVKHIVTAKGHRAHDVALFYRLVVDIVNGFVARVHDFNVNGIGLRIHAVNVFPFCATEMFDRATGNRFQAAFFAFPNLLVVGKEF